MFKFYWIRYIVLKIIFMSFVFFFSIFFCQDWNKENDSECNFLYINISISVFLSLSVFVFNTLSFILFNLGRTCEPAHDTLLQRLIDSFEGAIYKHYWESVRGGGIGIGCGTLRPHAHGKSLYFNGCGLRHAITQPLNLFTGGYVFFSFQFSSKF